MSEAATPPPGSGEHAPSAGAGAPVVRRQRGFFAALGRLGRELGVLLGYEHIPQMAAALAYRTIFSLVPLSLVAFLFVRLFKDPDSLVKSFLEGVLTQTGLKQLATDQGNEFNLQQWITDRVQQFRGIDFTVLGVVSAGLLVYAAISLLVEVETALNRVYGSNRARTWVRRILQYWMIVTVGPLLVAASFFVAGYFQRLTGEFSAMEEMGEWGPWLAGTASFVIPAVISALLLFVLYMAVPNTRVRVLPALIGAVVAAVFFELAKSGFSLYLRQEPYKSLYGTLSILPLFLLWIYVLWLIVLFGLRIAFMIQHRRMWALWNAWRGTAIGQVIVSGLQPHTPAEATAPEGMPWLDPTSLISIVAEVGRQFAHGRTAESSRVAEVLGIDESAVSRGLEQLSRAGMIYARGDLDGDQYALARPAEQIALGDVLLLGYQLLGNLRPGAEPAAVFELRQAQVAAARGRTLADVLARPVLRVASPPAGLPVPASTPGEAGVNGQAPAQQGTPSPPTLNGPGGTAP